MERTPFTLSTWVFLLFAIGRASCCLGEEHEPPVHLLIAVHAALDESDELDRLQLAARLQAYGYAALDRCLALHEVLEQERASANTVHERAAVTARLHRLQHLTDHVAGQAYSNHARLFWFRDLEDAKRCAANLQRPLLTLRLEGSLLELQRDREASLLVAAIYSNQQLARLMRERFVLHWQTDLSRTVQAGSFELSRGNDSRQRPPDENMVVHYMLTPDGTPVAALTRCVGPLVLYEWLWHHLPKARTKMKLQPDDAETRRQTHASKFAGRLFHVTKFPNHDSMLGLSATSGVTVALVDIVSFSKYSFSALASCWLPLQYVHWLQATLRLCEPDATSQMILSGDQQMIGLDQFGTKERRAANIAMFLATESLTSMLGEQPQIRAWLNDEARSWTLERLNAKVFQTFFSR